MILNTNLQKHGAFHSDLCIDESMVPYFGMHSAKMCMREKPVRYGYKLWILAFWDGFPYAIEIYTGKVKGGEKQPLGFRVVNTLLEFVKQKSNPAKHSLYFDNFFTSHDLMCHLYAQGFKATGTIRQNRCGGAQRDLIPDAQLKRQSRGS
jgi:hypothetical protein